MWWYRRLIGTPAERTYYVMALAMVVIASMIGVKGLGVPILRAISNQYLALGLLNGLAIVALAIIFDRVTQEYGRRMQKHRGQKK